MAVLPDRRIGEWSINKHRGCHDDWHDYEDRFLAALYKVLTKQEDRDLDLEDLVQLNKEDFEPFYGEEGGADSLMAICWNTMWSMSTSQSFCPRVIPSGVVAIRIVIVSSQSTTATLTSAQRLSTTEHNG